MTNAPRAVLLVALLATTGLTIVLGVTDPAAPLSYPTWFLIWNLFLAWIPVCFAAGFAAVRGRAWLLPLGLGWLTFLPNSPYLVTDLVHLGEGVELWRHVLQYGFAAWTGIILGVVSLRLVHDRIERDFGRLYGWAAVIVSIGLCAIGVVIGRFAALELLGFGDAARCRDGDDSRMGTFSFHLHAVHRRCARGRGFLRAGVPDHLGTGQELR